MATRPFAAFEWLLAGRYLRARKKERTVSVIAIISFLGIMLGVATLIIVMSVMNGFRAELMSKILGMNGHMIVQSTTGQNYDFDETTEAIRAIAGVTRAAPLVDDASRWFEAAHSAARTQGERQFSELVEEHHARLREERERERYAYDARRQAIGRIGLATVRDHRRKRLLAEHEARVAMLDIAEAYTPDLNAVLMLRIGQNKAVAS